MAIIFVKQKSRKSPNISAR